MKDNNEDTYKIFHGLKPVKRSHRQEGQSEYYYLDPRGTDRFADFKEIDVASEDAPNPKITAILRDDLKKNERDYYIWHTRKDEKVRGKHAEREGKIFNWHVPPTGGHPSEDYNCRCWAEPYRADMAEQFNITPKFDLSGLPQYAENNKANTTSDTGYTSTLSETPSEKFLSQDFFDLLGFKESSSDYTKHYDDKEGIGAIGMYQFRKPALQEIGYIDKQGKWTGKDGIFSVNDLRYNPQIQEKAVREFADRNYKYMQSYKVLSFSGQKLAGKVTNFPITISGMLAASHKEGGPMTAKYLKSLEKNKEGLYYLPYEKYSGNTLRSFLAIETRLREFADVDHN